jgi:hypothetical protein
MRTNPNSVRQDRAPRRDWQGNRNDRPRDDHRAPKSAATPRLKEDPMQLPEVPLPTQAYADRHARERLRFMTVEHYVAPPTVEEGPARRTIAEAAPAAPVVPTGARVLVYKQDPTVTEIAVRKAFLPKRVFAGPRDARIMVSGMPVVTPNVFGDLLVDPVTQAEAFDAVHTFAIVRMTLTMYERGMAGATLPWQWNTGGNTDPLKVFPHAGVTQNAFYSRDEKALKFFFFTTGTPPAQVFTCRSLDIVAHETGHAILDALKPGWLLASNPPQTGGLHESFGDLTAIFLALNQLDQCEALIAQTKADLHAKNFLSDLAEQFGLALGRPNGLRNADNNLRLSEAGTEVHAISQVFTGGMFDVLADLFALERDPARRDDAAVLHDVAAYLASVLIRGLRAAPAMAATYAHVVNKMLGIVVADGKPPAYRQALVNAFSAREVIAPTALSMNGGDSPELEAAFAEDPDAPQDRSTCCGTMQLPEFAGADDELAAELEALAKGPFA